MVYWNGFKVPHLSHWDVKYLNEGWTIYVKNQTDIETNEKIYLLNSIMKIGRKMKLKCDLFAMDEVEQI